MKNKGFTVIELSIVLVIIGLVLGGIFVGRDLIRIAEIRGTISQMEEFNMAVNTFKTKYNCLPGDCTSASDFGFDITSNGDGDTFIGAANQGRCRYVDVGDGLCSWFDGVWKEYTNFWYHLSAAGLIKQKIDVYVAGDITVYPFHTTTGISTPTAKLQHVRSTVPPGYSEPLPGGWSIQADGAFTTQAAAVVVPPAHHFVLGSMVTYPDIASYIGYAPTDLYSIDSKIDDGRPLSGRARAKSGALNISPSFPPTAYHMNAGAGGINSQFCIRNDRNPYEYNLAFSGTSGAISNSFCGLVIKAAF